MLQPTVTNVDKMSLCYQQLACAKTNLSPLSVTVMSCHLRAGEEGGSPGALIGREDSEVFLSQSKD